MKKLFAIAVLLAASISAAAQNGELEINYIAHDHFNESILAAVDGIYQSAAYNSGKKTYIYLANADEPVVMQCLGSESGRKQYEDFRLALNSRVKHNIWPEVDIKGITDLLKDDDFINDDGTKRYDFFVLNFYVTSSFWSYNYNETLIARLFWDLDLADKTDIQVNVYYPAGDEFKYDENNPFGAKRLNGDYVVYFFEY